MDWSRGIHNPAPLPPHAPPAAPRLTTLFRVVGPSERAIRCATYAVAIGTELRLEYEDRDDDLLRSQWFRAGEEEAIAEMAAAWRAAFDGRGFRELALL